MTNYISIQPITFSGLKNDFVVNAIKWNVTELTRGATSVKVICELINVSTETIPLKGPREVIKPYTSFSMDIPDNVLQAWGADDTVIDNFVLTYSPKFVKA